MSRKGRKKIRKNFILILVVILLAAGIGFFFLNKKVNIIDLENLDSIKDYGYTLKKNDTELMQNTFASLKEVLIKDDVDKEKYAEYLSELFIIDLYTIDNKNNKYDIGSVEYVYPDYVDSYKLKVQDTLYKYLKDSSKRKEDMPIVKSIEIDDIQKIEFTYNEKDYDGFDVLLSWDYEEDLGYDEEGIVTVIEDNNKLYVASFVPGEDSNE